MSVSSEEALAGEPPVAADLDTVLNPVLVGSSDKTPGLVVVSYLLQHLEGQFQPLPTVPRILNMPSQLNKLLLRAYLKASICARMTRPPKSL